MKKNYKFEEEDRVQLEHNNKIFYGFIAYRFKSKADNNMYVVSIDVTKLNPIRWEISYREDLIRHYVEPTKTPQYLSADGEKIEIGDLVISAAYPTVPIVGRVIGRSYWGGFGTDLLFVSNNAGLHWNPIPRYLKILEKGRK